MTEQDPNVVPFPESEKRPGEVYHYPEMSEGDWILLWLAVGGYVVVTVLVIWVFASVSDWGVM